MTDSGSSQRRGTIRTLVVAVGTFAAGWVMLPGFIVLVFMAPGGTGPYVSTLGLFVLGVPAVALLLTVWLKRPAIGLVGFLVGVGTSVLTLDLL